jgi:hypothetical protein
MSTEPACCNPNTALPCSRDKVLVETVRLVRRSSIYEGGPPLAGIRMQRELRHHQQLSLNSGQCQIHFPGGVGEHPQTCNPVLKKFRIGWFVSSGDSEQNYETSLDFADSRTIHSNFGAADTLNNCAQAETFAPDFSAG